MLIKNSHDTIGNRTRDPPARGAVFFSRPDEIAVNFRLLSRCS